MDEFEKLLYKDRISVERFVRFKLNSKDDADDVLQDVYITAYKKFPQLRKRDSFKAWIISIARNKCNDYYRGRSARLEIPIDEIAEKELSDSRYGVSEMYQCKKNFGFVGQ